MSYWQEPDPDNKSDRVILFSVMILLGVWVAVFCFRALVQ
jgi:hypothetical protein